MQKLLLLGAAVAGVSAEADTFASVYVSEDLKDVEVVHHASKEDMLAMGRKRKPVSQSHFQDTLMKTGWGTLEVKTNGDAAEEYERAAALGKHADDTKVSKKAYSIAQQGFAAGYAEGHLTAHRM